MLLLLLKVRLSLLLLINGTRLNDRFVGTVLVIAADVPVRAPMPTTYHIPVLIALDLADLINDLALGCLR